MGVHDPLGVDSPWLGIQIQYTDQPTRSMRRDDRHSPKFGFPTKPHQSYQRRRYKGTFGSPGPDLRLETQFVLIASETFRCW